MIASIHLADVGAWRGVPMLCRRLEVASIAGLRYGITVAAAPLGTSALAPPQPGRVGLFALWEDDGAIDGFLADHPMAATLTGGWHVRLAPLSINDYHRARGSTVPGSWPGVDGDLAADAPSAGPVVVITLAKTRPSQLPRFLKASHQASRSIVSAPGTLWATALARPPIVATCSLWASAKHAEEYAYGSDGGHHRAMAADRTKPFHQSGVFFRLRPYQSVGHLDGRNPLAASWLDDAVANARQV
jgi:hypothetical protein